MARILVVDDERDILTVTSMLLEMEGYSIHTAGNGVQALEIVHNDAIDLIVTDWMMPQMDGVELCTQLRADPATRHIPILLHTSAGSIPPGLGTLFDIAIPKLSGIDTLLGKIRTLLDADTRGH